MPLTFIWMYPKSPLQYILYFRHNPIAYRLQNWPDFQRRALFSRELRRPSEWIYFFWSSLERSDSTYRPFAFHGYFLSLKLTFYHKILTGNFISSWSFFPSIFCFWLIIIQLKILIIITTGVIIVGLCVRGSSVIQYLSCRPSFAPCSSSSLMLPTAFHQLTYTHFKQGTSSTAAMSSANTASRYPLSVGT